MKETLADGHYCIIRLQSTGEVRARDAAKQAGFNPDETSGSN